MVEGVTIKWQGKEYAIPVSTDDTVLSLKRKIEAETAVQPKRQKLLGLKAKAGGLAGDDVSIGDIILKPNQKIMMMGYGSAPHPRFPALFAQGPCSGCSVFWKSPDCAWPLCRIRPL